VARRHLVTGAAGVIGFELTRQLLEAGDEVCAVDLYRKGGREDLARLAERHAGRLQVLERDLAVSCEGLEGRFDGLLHLAAIVGVRYVTEHPYETVAVNLRSTLGLLDHARREGCGAFLFASSSENYASGVDAGFVPVPTPEDVILSIGDVALPRWSYAASKMAGESAVFGAAGEPGGQPFAPVIVRFHNVYGPRMGPTHVIPELLERCRRKVDPFPVYGSDQTRSFLYVEDAGRALRTVLDHVLSGPGRGGVYNIGSPHETLISELVSRVFEVTGFRPTIDERPAPPGSVRRRAPDISRLRGLGFEPEVDLPEGLRRCWQA
jgi:UDP-glucose 4-epimerase/UDP-glucuronate decarboxylase